MEIELRGLIEKFLDEELKPNRLVENARALDVFSPLFESKHDLLFGYLIGNVFGRLFHFTHALYNREPTLEERVELIGILRKKAPEIRHTISKVGW